MKDHKGYYLDKEIKTPKDALRMIRDISLDYDGYRDPEDLMELIDELREVAKTGLNR